MALMKILQRLSALIPGIWRLTFIEAYCVETKAIWRVLIRTLLRQFVLILKMQRRTSRGAPYVTQRETWKVLSLITRLPFSLMREMFKPIFIGVLYVKPVVT